MLGRDLRSHRRVDDGADRLGVAVLLRSSAFLLTQDEAGLFTVPALFGLGFAGIIPAYVLAVARAISRRARRAGGCRACSCLSGIGMASGGWLAGFSYDHFGYYAPAFAAGVGFNLLNLAVIGTLVLRSQFAR